MPTQDIGILLLNSSIGLYQNDFSILSGMPMEYVNYWLKQGHRVILELHLW